MRAYRVRSGRVIAPFLDEARDLWVGTETLAAWQEAAVRGAGLELEEIATPEEATERPCVIFWDDVFFTEMALRAFLADVLRSADDTTLALPASPLTRALGPMADASELEGGGLAFDVFHLVSPSGHRGREALRRAARPVLLSAPERTTSLRVPPAFLQAEAGGRQAEQRVEAPLTARIVGHVRHWLHLLRLSQLSIGVALLAELRRRPGLALRLRLGRARDPWTLGRRLRFVHPTARVHPTADIESAVIGPGAVIHAHAHVHRSVIGPGVEIGDHAVVMSSTLAERVQVLRGSYLALCAAMPAATLASYKVQLSLFGREVFLTSSAWLLDAKMMGEVQVEHEGRLVPVGSAFLGSCLGHRVTLGAQVTIQPGRALPNGVVVVSPPEQFASRVGSFPEGTLLTVREGRLVPL